MAALTVRCLTNLATPQQKTERKGDEVTGRQSPSLPVCFLEAMKGVEPLSTGLQDRRSVSQLSYIA